MDLSSACIDEYIPERLNNIINRVPKDYSFEQVGFALIAYARLPARIRPSRGTIFLNPGGPGGSGKQLVFGRGEMIAEMLGYDWDLVGFDPRGIGESMFVPSFPYLSLIIILTT